MDFCYPMIWKKDSAGNPLIARYATMQFFEDINVFRKGESNKLYHPLRQYIRDILQYIGKSAVQVQKDFVRWNIEHPSRVQHFLVDGLQVRLCTEETYNLLIEHYAIDKMENFRTWEDLNEEMIVFKRETSKTFNLPDGKQSISNVLEFAKDTDTFHPTQKPVDLIRYLVRTYSNEGETILDNCMGSGTTAIACIKEKRNFIGFELNKEYYEKACKRIAAEKAQLTLF